MVVDKYVGRCLDVGSTPTGSIIPLHSFAFLGKTLLNQRFLFLSLVFLGILLRKKHTTKESQTAPKADPIFEEGLLCLKINIIGKAFSDVILCLLSYVSINVHGRLQVGMS